MEDGKYLSRITDDDKVQAKKDNPDLKLCIIELELDNGKMFEGLFREPNNMVISRYVSAISNRTSKQDGIQHHNAFVLDCIIKPTKDEYFGMTRELPALPIGIATQLIEGHGLVSDSKKKSL